jgi:hypothetical protein
LTTTLYHDIDTRVNCNPFRSDLRKAFVRCLTRDPLPAWAVDFHLYTIQMPDDGPVTVTKRGQAPYVFSDAQRCCCMFKQSHPAKQCRHEAMVEAVTIYRRCPECHSANIEQRYDRCPAMVQRWLVCLDCEETHGYGCGTSSWRSDWLAGPGGLLTEWESRFVRALLGDAEPQPILEWGCW